MYVYGFYGGKMSMRDMKSECCDDIKETSI